MPFLMDQASCDELNAQPTHSDDCCVRPGEYPHHVYREGIKYVVARALYTCLNEAKARQDGSALNHLQMHETELRRRVADEQQRGTFNGRIVGVANGSQEEAPPTVLWSPTLPTTVEQAGLNRSFLVEMILRVLYTRSRATGQELSTHLGLFYGVINPILDELRAVEQVDIVGQRGFGDINYEFALTPRGVQAVNDALAKTSYSGVCPVPLNEYLAACKHQTIKNVVVTRLNIRRAFGDLIISEPVLNEVGPAVNSASSVFLFGYPGNGKTSIAERITRLMGDAVFVPHAIEADGQIIKVFDPIVHTMLDAPSEYGMPSYDTRWVKVKRPVVITGGELTLPMLDLIYNPVAKFYEAPFQMKANGGIFLIDDFGRQQCRPIDLLNRWIVPLEKRFDYLTTVTGKKIEIPFDQLIIFSSNLDPQDLADEAFLRRIKYKINVKDPDEVQWREIWRLVCKGRKVAYDDAGLDYLLQKWYKPFNRNLRMCHPRDILDQMVSMAKYSMEEVSLANPDLIDAACGTYFISTPKQNFGAQVRLRD